MKETHTQHYQRHLDNLLKNVPIPSATFWQDVLCKDQIHKDNITEWCEALGDCCIEAREICLPKCRKKCVNKPGWVEEVKPYKDASLLWHNIWVDDREPKYGDVYDAMKEAKRQYSYAVRRVTRRERQYRYENMAQAAASDKSRHFLARSENDERQ